MFLENRWILTINPTVFSLYLCKKFSTQGAKNPK